MFQFYIKKYFLVDFLSSFVDIHNHILPGIDDGAKTVEDSLELIKGYEEIGINKFIATPHIMHNYYDNTAETINASLEQLKDALLQSNMKEVAIEASAEHMIDDNFEYLLESGCIMTMRKDYLLIEMSYLQPPINFSESVKKIIQHNLFPILAHPERYNFIKANSKLYNDFKRKGLLFQLNLLSLGKYYDHETQKKAGKLLDAGLIDFAATDMHHKKHLKALKNITLSTKRRNQIDPIIRKTIESFY